MKLRILVFIMLLFSVLYLPFWISAILALTGILLFDFFWEGTIAMLISDLLYGVRESKLSSFVFVSFLITVVAVVLAEFFKKKMRFYGELK
jgi:hypothetical protein